MRAVCIFNALLNFWKLEFADWQPLGQIQEFREWDSMQTTEGGPPQGFQGNPSPEDF